MLELTSQWEVMYRSTGLLLILGAGAQYIMAAVIHYYYLTVSASLVNRLGGSCAERTLALSSSLALCTNDSKY